MAQPGFLKRFVFPLAILVVANFLSGCTSFNKEWQLASAQPIQANQLEGPWEGFWLSDVNRHTGKLRCVVTKKSDDIYRARFHARYGKLLSFGYTVSLRAQPQDGAWKFRGQANLGFLAGGVYYYDGHAEGTNFFSTYSSKYDHGTFQMKRP
jgi:hypothetical protein